jgi:hypothetical protein
VIVGRQAFLCVLVCGAIVESSTIALSPCAGPGCKARNDIAGDDITPGSVSLAWAAPGDEPTKSHVELRGLDPALLAVLDSRAIKVSRWNSFFRVHVVPAGKPVSPDDPPVLGSYQVQGGVVRFRPRFSLEPGLCYRALFDPAPFRKLLDELAPSLTTGEKTSSAQKTLSSDRTVPTQFRKPVASVVGVFPSALTLPENLLRFYVHFSVPMSRGDVYRHVKLLDAATGKAVDAPFLELGEELWTSDGTRITLLFDPGRIKRGLKPREEVGPVLEAGKSYTLVIDSGWPDARGTPLRSSFRKTFQVGPPDERSPDPKTWRIESPQAGSVNALVVHFPEPLDRALMDRLIGVREASGRTVAGRKSVTDGEKTWQFKPEAAWRPGDYRLAVGTELEDLAGNSIARPFEVDLFGPVTKESKGERINLPFRIAP